MVRQLSSGWTFFFKYVFSTVWIAMFGAGTVAFFLDPSGVTYNGVPGDAPPGVQWLFLAAWIAGSTFILWIARPLKRVRVVDGALLVSNYRQEIRVPVGLIVGVHQNRWINVRPVSVRLRLDVAGLGDRFTFLPSTRFRLAFWREDPEVADLRRLASLRPDTEVPTA